MLIKIIIIILIINNLINNEHKLIINYNSIKWTKSSLNLIYSQISITLATNSLILILHQTQNPKFNELTTKNYYKTKSLKINNSKEISTNYKTN